MLLFSFILFLSLSVFANDFYIIANNSVPDDSINRQRLQDIFLGDIGNWANGDRIQLATLRRGDANEAFLRDIIGRTAAQYNTYWKQIVFTGRGVPPQEFNNDDDMINYIASTRGAIGYISQKPESDDIKLIEIE